MTQQNNPFEGLSAMDVERQARALQARAVADMFRALRRAITARLHRNPAAHTA